eukprot:gene48412-59288_t
MFAGNPGLTTGYGGTHQAIEDLALMRAVPDMTVLDPCDATEMQQIAERAGEIDGTVYCRLLRGNVPVVFDPATYRFELGKAKRFGTGSDVGFISTGFMTERCLDAAAELARRGVQASVLHCSSIKPFDAHGVATFAASVDRLVTAENHVLVGGLTSLVLDALQEAFILKPMLKIGIPDRFIECGSIPYLQSKYGLTAERVRDAVADWMGGPGALLELGTLIAPIGKRALLVSDTMVVDMLAPRLTPVMAQAGIAFLAVSFTGDVTP